MEQVYFTGDAENVVGDLVTESHEPHDILDSSQSGYEVAELGSTLVEDVDVNVDMNVGVNVGSTPTAATTHPERG